MGKKYQLVLRGGSGEAWCYSMLWEIGNTNTVTPKHLLDIIWWLGLALSGCWDVGCIVIGKYTHTNLHSVHGYLYCYIKVCCRVNRETTLMVLVMGVVTVGV